MSKKLVLAISILAILTAAQLASAAPAINCNVPATTLNCGGTPVVDQGCSMQSCGTADEPICYQPECHSIENSDLFLCHNDQLPNCTTGADDGKSYVINHSSCFCD